MKKNLPTLVLLLMLFAACEKSADSLPETQMQKTSVKFVISDFSLTRETVGKAGMSTFGVADTLSNYANNLYYRVYDSSGTLVKSESQSSAQATFGTVSDTLLQGTYTVVFVASKKPLGFANTSLATDHFLDPSNTNWDDIFLKKLTLVVGSSPVNQPVILERIVAGLQLNVEDDPDDAFPVLTITVESDDSTYQLDNLTSANPVVKTMTSEPHGANTVFMHVLNTSRPAKVTIRAFDRNFDLVAEKIIDNVRFYPNRKTVFSGRITEDANLTVTVDPAWIVKEPVQF